MLSDTDTRRNARRRHDRTELIDWLAFDVAGLHRQGARCAQRRERLVLGVPPPSFAMAHCHENRILRQ